MLKVMTVVGTRPEIIRLSRTIEKLDRFCEHVLVHTGQNYDYELNGVFFSDLGIRKPDHFLEAAGGSAAETIAKVIMNVESSCSRTRRIRPPVAVFRPVSKSRTVQSSAPVECGRTVPFAISTVRSPARDA